MNSDCKPCTGSKLGWVHGVHTQGPGCAHALRLARVHAANALRLGRALGVMSWPLGAVLQGPPVVSSGARLRYSAVSQFPCRDTKIVSRCRSPIMLALRDVSQRALAMSQAVSRAHVAVSQHHVTALLPR